MRAGFVAFMMVLCVSARAGEVKTVTAEIDTTAAGTPISPYIYGIAQADTALAVDMGVTIRRLGGNPCTPYNWKEGFSSSGADWWYVNTGKAAKPEENWWGGFLKANKEAKLEGYFTLPMMGRVAKDGTSVAFDIKKYPNQEKWIGQEHPTWDYAYAGNGRQFELGADGKPKKDDKGNPLIKTLEPDPNDTSIEMPQAEQTRLLDFMINDMKFGKSGAGGVSYIALDNEPGLWHTTHHGMRPVACSYDELWQRTRDYAAALKKIDPNVKIGGPTSWGWTEYFYSGLDAQLIGQGKGSWNAPPDQAAHGKVPLTKWYLQQLADYEKKNGVRLVDILDFHFYPQANVDGKAHDPAVMENRVQETRVMWDPNFKDPSWMGSETGKVLRIIPLMRDWVAESNPGMKLAIGEYDFKGQDDASGGVAQAELLGVFARERLDFGFYWFAPNKDTPIYFGFRMFRNPDGKHTAFGDSYLPAVVSAPDDVSVHAAKDSKTGMLTLILINKRGKQPAKVALKFKNALPEQSVPVYEYSDSDAKGIKVLPEVAVKGEQLEIELSPMSVKRIDLKL